MRSSETPHSGSLSFSGGECDLGSGRSVHGDGCYVEKRFGLKMYLPFQIYLKDNNIDAKSGDSA